MTITFKDMEPQAREILGLPEQSDANMEQLALYKALALKGLGVYQTPADRINALLEVFRAEDTLRSLRNEREYPGSLEYMQYTPEAQKERLLPKADQFSRVLETRHGRVMIREIAKALGVNCSFPFSFADKLPQNDEHLRIAPDLAKKIGIAIRHLEGQGQAMANAAAEGRVSSIEFFDRYLPS